MKTFCVHCHVFSLKRFRIGLVFILIFVFILTSVMPALAALQAEPVARLSVGRDLYQTDLFTGSASYAYPIKVPKGTSDLTPDVSLSYTSQAAFAPSAYAGMGWDLNLDYIETDANFTPGSTGDDKYRLHFRGATYDLVYVSGESRYHTKIESNLHITTQTTGEANDSNMYWQVITPDGIKYRFGQGTNSEQMCTDRGYAYRWNLDQVEDRHLNKIFYTYTESSGASYLNKIEYNNDKSREVDFSYTTNPFQKPVYVQGCNVTETQQLASIQVKANSSLVHQFDLGYQTATNSSQLLQSITERGTTGSASALPATTFEYKPEIKTWNVTEEKWIDNANIEAELVMNDVRLIDVNGDALPDIVKTTTSGGSNTWKVHLNQGNKWATTSATWVNNYGMDAALDKADTRLIDVTGDALPDIVKSSGTTWKVWKNTGTSWNTTEENWISGVNINADLGTGGGQNQIVDVNGDGLADIVKTDDQGGGYVKWDIFKNTGSGWVTTGDPWIDHVWLDGTTLDDASATLMDVNGDGLPDIVRTYHHGGNSVSWKIYKNTGSSWLTTPDPWVDHADIFAYLGHEETTLADANGDGLPDIVKSYEHGDSYNKWIVFLNKGNSWSTTYETWVDDQNINTDVVENTATLADVTGDGLADIVRGTDTPGGSYVTWSVYRNNGRAPALLSKVNTSQGGSISFDYKPSTSSDNTGPDTLSDLPFPLWLVDTMTTSNGMTNSHQTSDNTSYSYKDGLYDWQDREFRGFAEITETLPNAAKRKYSFYQDDALKGRLSFVQTTDGSGLPYAKNEQVWGIATSSGVMALKLDAEKQYTYDGATASAKIKQTNYLYDSYGNPTKISELGDLDLSGDERFTYNEFTASTSAWLVNTLKHTYKNASDDSTKVAETYLYYDQHSGNNDAPHFGDVTREVKWLSGGSNPETNFTYDSYGNVATVKDPNNNTTSYSYDSTKTYPTTSTNAKSQATTYSYDLGTGNLLSQTDPNGLVTSFEYDIFGRISKEIKPYDNSSYPSISYQYFTDGVAPEGTLVSKREVATSAAALDVYTAVDGLGRKIQTRADAEDTSKQIVTDTFYEPTGQVKKQTVPYIASTSALTPTPTPTPQFSLADKTSNTNTLTNHGTDEISSSLPFTTSNKAVQAVRANSDYLEASDSASLSFTGNFTFEFWTKFNSLPSNATANGLISKMGSSPNWGFFTDLLHDNTKTYPYNIRVNISSSGSNLDEWIVGLPTAPVTGTWYHYAIVYTAASHKIEFFINGTSIGSSTAGALTAINNNASPLVIGADNITSPGNYNDAYFDDVRIWNTARTQSQIATNRGTELTGTESGLVAYYPFEYDLSAEPPSFNPYATPDASAKYTEMSYDLMGRVSISTSPKGLSRTTAYDHWKETNIDEKGSIKRNFFTAFDKINRVEEVLGATTSATLYTYNARDDLTQITDDKSNVFGFTYDTLSRKTAQSDPDMGNWSYGYDPVGNLTSTTDARGVTTTRMYDELNRVTAVNYPTDTDNAFTYDIGKIGVLSIATDSAGTVSYTYDNRLRKTQESRTISGTTKTTNFAYDSADRLTTQTNPDTTAAAYTFNNQGEIESLTGILNNVDYNALGKITKKDFANGVTTNYSYNTDDFRLNRIQTGSLFDKNYTYDAVGNIATMTNNLTSKLETFTYDDLDRLKTATESAGYNYAYDYNSIGNLTKFTDNGLAKDYIYGVNAGKHAITGITGEITPQPTTNYSAQYFNNTNLSGSPVLSRTDSSINFDWGNGSPDAAVNLDNFSARWTKTINFEAGTYIFSTITDDGVRLYIDNVLVIDKWAGQSSVTHTAAQTLSAGNHDIKVEYYEGSGGAVAKFNYQKLTDDFTGEYFSNKTLSGTPSMVRNDPAINFDWVTASAAASLPRDNFSTRWTKVASVSAGMYQFTIKGDDGIRLYVDDELLIDGWNSQAGVIYTTTKVLTGGVHRFRIEYYDDGWDAIAQFTYSQAAGAYTAEYFNNQTLSGVPVATMSAVAVDFDWGDGSPDPGVSANQFSARFTKTQAFEAGTYEFSITGDDGIRLFIDGTQVINGWVDQGSVGYTTTQTLSAGSHTIKVEYYEAWGGAVAKLSMNKTDTNLALSHIVASSSAENNDPNLLGAKAVDYNAGTRWSSNAGDPQWIYVDLGSRKTINRIKLNWHSNYGSEYQIQVSDDASSWTTVKSVGGGNGGIDDVTGFFGTGRYVRMYGTQRGTANGYSLYEFEVYGNTAPSFLTPSGSFFSVYDANGNLISEGQKCYEYNQANQLRNVKRCADNQVIAEYVYDYKGQRIVKKNYTDGVLSNTITSWTESFETKANVGGSTDTTVYFYANSELVAKKNPDGNKHYYHNDHLGSSSVITNQAGSLVEATSYDPYGKVLSGGTVSKYQYTGQEKDSESGLNYYKSRYYGSDVRRFVQPDSLIPNAYDPQQLNRYSYANNNPLKYTDPTGHINEILSYNNALNQYNKKPSATTYNSVLTTASNIQKQSGQNGGGSTAGAVAVAGSIAQNKAGGLAYQEKAAQAQGYSVNTKLVKEYGIRPDIDESNDVGDFKRVKKLYKTKQIKNIIDYAESKDSRCVIVCPIETDVRPTVESYLKEKLNDNYKIIRFGSMAAEDVALPLELGLWGIHKAILSPSTYMNTSGDPYTN